MTILDLSPSNRFPEWRRFRETLRADASDISHLTDVGKYWASCPVVNYYLDWDDPESWPSPWQLIHDGQLCPSGIALCIYYTLLYVPDSRWVDRLRILLIKDEVQGMFLVVEIDGEHILNFINGRICSTSGILNTASIMAAYVFDNGKYISVGLKEN